jgi:hypothetical protein
LFTYSFLSARLPPPALARCPSQAQRATTSEAQHSGADLARPLWHAAAAIPHGASVHRCAKLVLCRAQGALAHATEQMLARGACAPRAGAHPDRRVGPRLEAHWRAPCTAATSCFMIRPSIKVALHAENARCKSMFKVFQMLHLDVASVLCVYCKSRLGCCICCNDCTRMLQAFIPNVSVVFLDVCCKCVYLNVARVSHICCMCFIWMLYIFCNDFFQVFFRCFYKCFRFML